MDDRQFVLIVFFLFLWWILTGISCLSIAKVRHLDAAWVWACLGISLFCGPLIGLGASMTIPPPRGAPRADLTKILAALVPSLIGFAGTFVSAIAG